MLKNTLFSRRSPNKRREDVFYLLIVSAILVVNFIGFASTYYNAGILRAPLPSFLVHLHGALFSLWLLLLLTQTMLVSTGKVRWHRRLGVLGGMVAAMMLIVAPLTLMAALHRHAFATARGAAFVVVADVEGVALFGSFVVAGLFKRNNVVVHKRLMLFATIAILGPALSRWPFHFMDWPPAIFLLWLAFPLSVLLFETLSQGKPYSASVLSSLVILVYLLSVAPLSSTQPVKRAIRSVGYAYNR